jgi:hypothetical protein
MGVIEDQVMSAITEYFTFEDDDMVLLVFRWD